VGPVGPCLEASLGYIKECRWLKHDPSAWIRSGERLQWFFFSGRITHVFVASQRWQIVSKHQKGCISYAQPSLSHHNFPKKVPNWTKTYRHSLRRVSKRLPPFLVVGKVSTFSFQAFEHAHTAQIAKNMNLALASSSWRLLQEWQIFGNHRNRFRSIHCHHLDDLTLCRALGRRRVRTFTR